MANLQDLRPGEQADIWGDILETNLIAINTELVETTALANDLNTRVATLEAGDVSIVRTSSTTGLRIVPITQTGYDDLLTKDASTLYLIVG